MNIALIGYGKMGKTIEGIALKKDHSIVLKIDLHNIDELNIPNLSKADVAIEFTGPDSAPGNLLKCLEAGIPVVCGSTGWLDQYEDIKNKFIAAGLGFLYASNFSVGVNIFFELNKKLAALMAPHTEYSLSITETHHTQKKDAPSGTAITLAEQIIDLGKEKKSWVNHPNASENELYIISKRQDPAPGTHLVSYTSAIDDIEIVHIAHNRDGFASGAVIAAEFIFGKKGAFSMKEALGL